MKWNEAQIKQLAQKFNLSIGDIREIVEIAEETYSLDTIFSKFPNASTCQRKQTQLIFSYSPASAMRYLQACENYRKKKQNESTSIRYNRRN